MSATPKSTTIEDLAGPGGVEKATIRWDVTAQLTLTGETHLGGDLPPEDQEVVDLPLNVDADGIPVLRFRTLRGLMRHHLEDRLAGYDQDPSGDGAAAVAKLFGDTDRGSRLSGADVRFTPAPGCPPTLVRDHVSHDPDSASAAHRALWSAEVVTAGSTGTLQVTLTVAPGEKAELLELFCQALEGFTDPLDPIRIGARTTTGAGTLTTAQWTARRYDLTDPDQYLQAITEDWDQPTDPQAADAAASSNYRTAREAVLSVEGTPEESAQGAAEAGDARTVDLLELTVSVGVPDPESNSAQSGLRRVLPGFLRVGATPPPGREDVNAAQRTVPVARRQDEGDAQECDWQPAIGGDAYLSWLRRQVELIARTLDEGWHTDSEPSEVKHSPTCPVSVAQELFGDRPGSDAPQPGRVFVSSSTVTGGELQRRGRSAVDPVFGGTILGRLFTELVLAGGTDQTLRVLVRRPTDAARGLLAHAIVDAHDWCRDVLGGGGHGHVTVTAAHLTMNATAASKQTVDLLKRHEDCPGEGCPDPRHVWQRALKPTPGSTS